MTPFSKSIFNKLSKDTCTKNEEILNGKLHFLCNDTQFDSLWFLVTGV